MELTKDIATRLPQRPNAALPMVATEPGMVSVPAALTQLENAKGAMPVSLLADARLMLARLPQTMNAAVLIVATDVGMISEPVAPTQLAKAASPIRARAAALAKSMLSRLLH